MFTITCSFEEESGADAMNPLGDLEFADGHSILLISTTYLDSWLESMIEAINQIRTGATFEVSVPEERETLHLNVGADDRVTIRYENDVVVARDRQEFETALREACTHFLNGVSNQDESTRNPAIQRVRMFSQSTANDQ